MPTAANLSAYLDAQGHQDSVLLYLIQGYAAINNLDKVDSLLLGENREDYTRAVVGLRVQRGDIEGAEDILDTLSLNTQDDEWFVDIMEINFKVQQSDTVYRLTEPEETLMNTIIESDTSVMMGYACALLSLCSDSSCDLGIDSVSAAVSVRPSPVLASDALKIYNENTGSSAFNDLAVDRMSVYPNPAHNRFTIEYSLNDGGSLMVRDILGQVVWSKEGSAGDIGKYSVSPPVPGIYFVYLVVNLEVVDVVKVLVLN